jgi:tRNA (guanine-N7-)-methyltransferase
MPHIVFKKNELLSTPSQHKGVDFNFIAQSYNNTDKPRKTEYKISVTHENRDFLLTLKEKEENFLLKADKVTRVTPIELVKQALNEYVDASKGNVEFSNTHNISNKAQPNKLYLKEIDYFVQEFQTTKEIQIEIGFGSGRHLLHQAAAHPEVQFIGLEIHTPSIEQVLKQINIQQLDNILIVNYDARLFMEFIKSNKVGRIFVHFPVPWDKKPHRRIYSNQFIDEALRVLKPSGTLELRTDSRKYFDYCMELLTHLNTGRITLDINKDLNVSSKYEDRWKKQGKNIYDVVLECNREDKEQEHKANFDFDTTLDFESCKKQLPTKAIIEKDFFVHIEEIYDMINHNNSGLIQVTFGSFNRPLSKYLLIQEGKISYFQGKPIPTSANIQAHEKLKEIL